MKNEKKLQLKDLKVESFITKQNEVKGGIGWKTTSGQSFRQVCYSSDGLLCGLCY